jgi:hypothetical protein
VEFELKIDSVARTPGTLSTSGRMTWTEGMRDWEERIRSASRLVIIPCHSPPKDEEICQVSPKNARRFSYYRLGDCFDWQPRVT